MMHDILLPRAILPDLGEVAERLNALDSKSSMEVSFIGGSNPPLSVDLIGIRNGVRNMTPFLPFWGVSGGLVRLCDSLL